MIGENGHWICPPFGCNVKIDLNQANLFKITEYLLKKPLSYYIDIAQSTGISITEVNTILIVGEITKPQRRAGFIKIRTDRNQDAWSLNPKLAERIHKRNQKIE